MNTNGLARLSQQPVDSLFSDIDSFFGSFLDRFSDRFPILDDSKLLNNGRQHPRLDLSEDDKHYYVEVALPGWDKKDINVLLEDDVLTLSGTQETRSENSSRKYIERNIARRNFQRRIRLPNVDSTKVSASLANGLLHLKLPKVSESKSSINVVIS